MLADQNSVQEEIKSRLKLGNAGYHSVQNFFDLTQATLLQPSTSPTSLASTASPKT
jgi:hypothetical protein